MSPQEQQLTDDKTFELNKLEYTSAVTRHDNIYKSLWTNFSYMAILAGGILTVGKGELTITFLALLACSPLIFWFWSSYLPLDRYGNQTARRIAEIERYFNVRYFNESTDYSLTEYKAYQSEKARAGLFLYADFEHRKEKVVNPVTKSDSITHEEKGSSQNTSQQNSDNRGFISWLEDKVRVRKVVGICALLLHLGFVYLFITWASNSFPVRTEDQLAEKPLDSININVQNLKYFIDGLRASQKVSPSSENPLVRPDEVVGQPVASPSNIKTKENKKEN